MVKGSVFQVSRSVCIRIGEFCISFGFSIFCCLAFRCEAQYHLGPQTVICFSSESFSQTHKRFGDAGMHEREEEAFGGQKAPVKLFGFTWLIVESHFSFCCCCCFFSLKSHCVIPLFLLFRCLFYSSSFSCNSSFDMKSLFIFIHVCLG